MVANVHIQSCIYICIYFILTTISTGPSQYSSVGLIFIYSYAKYN